MIGTSAEIDDGTQAFIQELHGIWSQQAPQSAYDKLRDGLLSERDQLDTHIITLCSVAKIACPAGLDGNAQWQTLFDLASQIEGDRRKRKRAYNEANRLRNFALVAALWSLEVVYYYGWDKIGQVQMSAIRACATQYPRFREDLTPRLNFLLLQRHREAIVNGRRKTLDEAPLQPLRDLNIQLLAAVIPNEHVIQQWVTSTDGRVAVDDDGTLLSEVRSNHYHMYLLRPDRYGLIISRGSDFINANGGLSAHDKGSINPACSDDIIVTQASACSDNPPVIDPGLNHPGDALCDTPNHNGSRSSNATSSVAGLASTAESRTASSIATQGGLSLSSNSHFHDSFSGRDGDATVELLTNQVHITGDLSLWPEANTRVLQNWPFSQSHRPSEPQVSRPEGSILPAANHAFDNLCPLGDFLPFDQSDSCIPFPASSEILGNGYSMTSASSMQFGNEADAAVSSIVATQTNNGYSSNYYRLDATIQNEGPHLRRTEPGFVRRGAMGEAKSEYHFSGRLDQAFQAGAQPMGLTTNKSLLGQPESQAAVTVEQVYHTQHCDSVMPCITDTVGEDNLNGGREQQIHHVAWLSSDVQWANIFEWPGNGIRCGQPRSEYDAEVVQYTSEDFITNARQGHVFRKPILIKEQFSDSNMHTAKALALQLHDRSTRSTLDVRRLDKTQPMHISLETIADGLRTGKPWESATALSFRNITKCQRPLLTMLPRFRLLDCLMERESGGLCNVECEDSLPQSMEDYVSFNVCGLDGTFSDAYLNTISGAWIRILDGTAIWMIVPEKEMEGSWVSFTDQGQDWLPDGKQRCILLRQDDVLLLPPGLKIVQAMHTSTTTIIEGGLIWDELNVIQTLHCISWELENSTNIQSAMSRELPRIIEELVALVTKQPDRFRGQSSQTEFLDQFAQHVSDINSMRCDCGALRYRKSQACPCGRAWRF